MKRQHSDGPRQGETASRQLYNCFSEDSNYDYPRQANLDGSIRPISLSNRVVANCDRIMKTYLRTVAQVEAAEKRKDEAYDKAHKGGRQ